MTGGDIQFEISFEALGDTRDRKHAEEFLRIVRGYNPIYVPTKLDIVRRTKIDLEVDKESVIRHYQGGYLWMETSKRGEDAELSWSYLVYGDDRLLLPRAYLRIENEKFLTDKKAVPDLPKIADDLYCLMKACYGKIGVGPTYACGGGVFDSTVRISIPDIYWITYFGPIYQQIIPREKFVSAPCHSVQEMPDGGFKLVLTEGYRESISTAGRARAQEVKEHLGEEYFRHPEDRREYGDARQRETPAFDLSKMPRDMEMPSLPVDEMQGSMHASHRTDPDDLISNAYGHIDALRARFSPCTSELDVSLSGLSTLDGALWDRWLETTSREYWHSVDLWTELTAYVGELIRITMSGEWKCKNVRGAGRIAVIEFDQDGKHQVFDPLETVGYGLGVVGGGGSITDQLKDRLRRRRIRMPGLVEK